MLCGSSMNGLDGNTQVTFNGATTTRESTIASLTSEVNLLRGQVGKGETETQSFLLIGAT